MMEDLQIFAALAMTLQTVILLSLAVCAPQIETRAIYGLFTAVSGFVAVVAWLSFERS
jgi:hypothetical protein